MARFDGMIHGVDISQAQGGNIRWSVLRNPAGFPENLFCLARAGGSYTAVSSMYVDKYYVKNITTAPVYFPYAGAYWLFVPRGGEAYAIKQAEKFWEIVKDTPWVWLVADVEKQPWGYNVSPAEFEKCLRAFIKRVQQLSGVKCWIYTRGSFWNDYLGSPSWAGGYPLHTARYHSTLSGPWADNRYRTRPWADLQPGNEWKRITWQHSADGNNLGATFGVESGSIDRNVFNGTRAEFEEMLEAYGRFQPPPPPEDDILGRLDWLEEEVEALTHRVNKLEGKIFLHENGGS